MTADQAIQLGLQHHNAGNLREAESMYRQVLSNDPQNADALHLLGMIARQVGKLDIAIELIHQAIAINPNVAIFFANLCEVQLQARRANDAIAAGRRAIALDPYFPVAHGNLADALKLAGQIEEAESASNRADALANYQLGNALDSQGQNDKALAAFRRAVELDPKLAEPYNSIGAILSNRGEHQAAIEAYENAIRLRPDMAIAYSNLGNTLRWMGRPEESVIAGKKAVELCPSFAGAHANLGNALHDQGLIAEAIDSYYKAIELQPDLSVVHDNLLFTLHFQADCDGEQLLAAHRRWAAQYADHLAPATTDFPNSRDPERPLRIGYVSPDFRMHPIVQFLKPLLTAHDRGNFHIICYSDVLSPDRMTEEMKALANEWRDIRAASDEALADLVRKDRIDILVDLSLHSARNRLLTFARKPAPIQVSYLGYPGTTGVRTIDYRFTDPYLDPPDAPQLYTEKSLYLPRTYWCYSAWDDAPPVTPSPFESAGHITFGCLNSFTKVSSSALDAWAQILNLLPDARMILYCGEGSHRERVRDAFHGRVEFVSRQSPADYLKTYCRIDIALDPFPYGGGTTTCDALWMGVPVITVAGKIAVQRSGVSVLNNIGLPAFIAQSPGEYVDLAIQLANDRARITELRASLRSRMLRSPLMDGSGFARDVEAAFRKIWREWCRA